MFRELPERVYDALGRPDTLFRLYQRLRTVRAWIEFSLVVGVILSIITVLVGVFSVLCGVVEQARRLVSRFSGESG